MRAILNWGSGYAERCRVGPHQMEPALPKILSPCVDVCKFKLEGKCLGCAMTKKQKKAFRGLKTEKKKLKFITKLVRQQHAVGRHHYWRRVYLKKCAKKGVEPPLAA